MKDVSPTEAAPKIQGKNATKTLEKTTPLTEVVISLYEAQEKIYPRSTSGFFTKWRWVMIWLTQLFFYGVPWINWGHRQALLFDLETKRFYIFNLVLYPQDLIYLTAILVISALSLFLFTAIAGRLWCGYTCPQTVYTEIFLWIERKIEGDRAARMKLDTAAMTTKKLVKKSCKHFAWIAFALWTGFTFVGYFTPIRALANELIHLNISPWETFWVCFYGFATYGNAGFLREQVCKYMCPYARFQSAMFDDDTLVVTYDEARGEPRGGRSRKLETSKTLGSCIDCSLCVQVCPTGIDIRKGLQYECIGCGACADVCDTVMDKMGYARGLIKYSTQNTMTNKWSHKQMMQRILRPRVIIYTSILAFLVSALLASLWLRTPFRVDVIRDRGVMARLADGGMLENVYRLQIMNGTESIQHYQLNATGIKGLLIEVDGTEINQDVIVKPAESRWLSLRLEIPDGSVEPGSYPVEFEIKSLQSKETVTEKSIFLVPR
ncbi:cytochrome c oxidase accessory protein CcoG [Methylotenera versatilis]|uniref:cytochrome c oxidase accessory protein CcoG n=1 Tax=Methylotenera versatilis TaxID=1055487 RepID=UPI0009DCC74D|nr:cytochrome c oxidase accessory protein CcoG [Methylotenera versatilis]